MGGLEAKPQQATGILSEGTTDAAFAASVAGEELPSAPIAEKARLIDQMTLTQDEDDYIRWSGDGGRNLD